MKILIIISSLDNGGTENHLLNILPLLKVRGMDVSVLTLKPGGYIGNRLKDLGFIIYQPELRFIDPLRNVLLFIYIFMKLIVLRPKFVHFFLPKAYLIGGLASLLTPFSRRIMSRRSLNIYQQDKPVSALIERLLHKTMFRVSGNSKSVINELMSEGVTENKLQLIYNGVREIVAAEKKICQTIREEWGALENFFIIIYVANLIDYKGHADLIQALSIIKDDLPIDWRLICVGKDTGSRQSILKLIEDRNMTQNIVFTGERIDVQDIMSCADIGVIASHQEGFSNSLLEKMSAGLPVIATDVGGNREAIINGESGILVPAKKPEAMAKAILKLSNDLSLQKKMGTNAKNRTLQHFSLKSCVEHYIKLYAQ
ncbi:MAG: glycosyltransferase involved in cell wall biosynthesis [Gammaproteobacteria bacterium]